MIPNINQFGPARYHGAVPAPLVIDDVTVGFGDVVALDRVTLTVAPATAVALIGPNGSGKTTLLDVIAGLRQPTHGAVDAAGARVGYVAQRHGGRAFVPLTCAEVVTMGCYRRRGLVGRVTAEDRALISDVAARLELDGLLHRNFSDLSGGQRQRVLIAQALVSDPQILLLDEPITGLDLASQERILELIETETERGTTVVISTHHLDEARHCDQVILLANRVVADGSPDVVLTPGLLRQAYAGRVLGDHRGHAHADDLLVLDDHGHDHPHHDHSPSTEH